MNTHLRNLSVAVLLTLLTCSTGLVHGIVSVSERPQKESPGENNYSANPLILNGKPLEYADFSLISRGSLSVVAGNAESETLVKIPFRIYLRRDGMLIHKGASDSSREVYDIDVATVLSLAQVGDELVIDPVRRTDGAARRIIRVRSIFWLFPQRGC
ncbi:hypothetical protein [Spirosoma koreense]